MGIVRRFVRGRLERVARTGRELVRRERPSVPTVPIQPQHIRPWGHILIVDVHTLKVDKTPLRGLQSMPMDQDGRVTLQLTAVDMRNGKLYASIQPENVLLLELDLPGWSGEFEVDLNCTDREHRFEFTPWYPSDCVYTLMWWTGQLYSVYVDPTTKIIHEKTRATANGGQEWDPTQNPNPHAADPTIEDPSTTQALPRLPIETEVIEVEIIKPAALPLPEDD